jgi:hypothetical protein
MKLFVTQRMPRILFIKLVRKICPTQIQKGFIISQPEHTPFSFVISKVKPHTGIVCDIDKRWSKRLERVGGGATQQVTL